MGCGVGHEDGTCRYSSQPNLGHDHLPNPVDCHEFAHDVVEPCGRGVRSSNHYSFRDLAYVKDSRYGAVADEGVLHLNTLDFQHGRRLWESCISGLANSLPPQRKKALSCRSTMWGIHSVNTFCRAYLECLNGCWDDIASIVIP